MAIITISRGSYSRGIEIAKNTARRLGYRCISREDLLKRSPDFNLPEIKLIRAFEDGPSILNRFTHGREKYTAYIQAALLQQLRDDDVVYHGFAYHAFIQNMPWVLNVLTIADLEDRANTIIERDRVTKEEAIRFLRRIDEQRRRWSRRLYGLDPWDPRLYDVVLRINKLTVKDAVGTICRTVALDQFQTTPEDLRILHDMALAAEVKTALVEMKPNIGVTSENGFVYIRTDPESARNETLIRKMKQALEGISGIRQVHVVASEPSEKTYRYPSGETRKSTGEISTTFFSEL